MALFPLLNQVGLDIHQGSLEWPVRLASLPFKFIGLAPTLPAVLALFFAVVAACALMSHFSSLLEARAASEFVLEWRNRLYGAILRTSWSHVARSRESDWTAVLTTEMDRAGAGVQHLIHVIVQGLVCCAYVAVAAQISWPVTLLVTASGAAIFWLLRGRLRAARRTGEELSRATAEIYGEITDHLLGLKVTKSFGAEDRAADRFSRLGAGLARLDFRSARLHSGSRLAFEIASAALLCALIYAAAGPLAIPAAGVLLLIFIFFRLMPKISDLQLGLQEYLGLRPALEAARALRERCLAEAEPALAAPPPRMERAIRFDRVSFDYGGRAALRDLTLDLPAGRVTALVGPSGAGKTTAADLLLGLLSPSSGRILVDGAAVEPARLRELAGYVPQDGFIFHDTLRANLLWARPEASDDDLRSVLGTAAAQFWEGLPRGLDTDLGDRGVRLSAGERQRVALARALLKKPSLLVLDEATSQLDPENERVVLSAIDSLRGQVTVLLITHRLSAARGADAVHVLDAGRLVESGTWEELAAGSGRFRQMASSQ
jgi:ATP-binding cassette subfamily C protein